MSVPYQNAYLSTYQSQCYCTNLRKSAGIVSEFYDQALKPSGITISQYYLLTNLSRLGSANITHWASRVGLDRTTMVRNIKLLQSRGFVETTEGHGKTFVLSLEGARALQRAAALWENAQKQIENLLGPQDLDALFRISNRLRTLEQLRSV